MKTHPGFLRDYVVRFYEGDPEDGKYRQVEIRAANDEHAKLKAAHDAGPDENGREVVV